MTSSGAAVRVAPRIHVFIGTKAQYIKTGPLLRLMDAEGVPYRLIDSGQHAVLARRLRRELGVREPDLFLGGERDIDTIPQAIGWALGLARRLPSRRWLRREVFAGRPGICVVHGDTPSTFLSALMARRAGLPLAHLEAGLRSHHLLHPFPEELVRLVVMRMADVLFAPDDTSVHNLRAMHVRGDIVPVPGNTVVESLVHGMDPDVEPGSGPAVVTMHRVENLNRRERVRQFERTVRRIAARRPVTFVVHGPTRQLLRSTGLDRSLPAAGVELRDLLPHAEFVRLLAGAAFVITDGGSIQEECALLGVPTLLWRRASERPDGLGRNVVLSRYDPAVVDDFLATFEQRRVARGALASLPSRAILDHLCARLEGQDRSRVSDGRAGRRPRTRP